MGLKVPEESNQKSSTFLCVYWPLGSEPMSFNKTWPYPTRGFSGGSTVKESVCNVEDLGSIPGLGRSPREGNSYPLQYSENSMELYSPRGCQELNMTEQLSLHFHFIQWEYRIRLCFGVNSSHRTRWWWRRGHHLHLRLRLPPRQSLPVHRLRLSPMPCCRNWHHPHP